MPIVINGSGSITGISAGGLPDGCVTADDLASGVGGKILQVVSATKTDTFSTSNQSFTDITGLSVSITPVSSSNKIFVSGFVTGLGTSNTRAVHRLVRDSTAICIGDAAGNRARAFGGIYTNEDGETPETVSFVHLDSPSTTSATTYKIQISNGNASDAVYVNRGNTSSDDFAHPRTTSSITVMEVAA